MQHRALCVCMPLFWVLALVFCPVFLHRLSAQVYQDFNLYGKFNTTILDSNTKLSTPLRDTERNDTIFRGNFDAYLMYSFFYNAFYLSVAPQFKMQNSKPEVLFKELLLSYSFDELEISLGKTKETRYLTNNKDYLTVRNRELPFVDDFSFWKLSMYVPLEFVTFELGSKLVRTKYHYEWQDFDKAFSKNYLYIDGDYAGFSSHVGYAYTYDIEKKNNEHDITAQVGYTYEDIIGGYFANLVALTQGTKFSLKDYSYTLGLDFSFAKAFGSQAVDFDVMLNTELIYEQEKYSIAPRLIFFYDQLSIFTVFSYTFDNTRVKQDTLDIQGNKIPRSLMRNVSSIRYTFDMVTLGVFHVWKYFKIENEHYNREQSIHTFGLEVIYEF